MNQDRMKPRVLVIEDEPGIRSTLQRYIVLSGYEAVLSPSGPEALKILEQTTPDLIFLDVSLPDSDGLAVLRELHDKHENIRVVMMAASADIPKANIALNCGAADYIAKPIDLPTIKRTLQLHLPH